MFTARLTAFAERFITDRSFALIVEPALADFQFVERRCTRFAS